MRPLSIIRWVSTGGGVLFLFLMWLLASKYRLAFMVAWMLSATSPVWAVCTTHTVYGPGGSQQLCTTCCDHGTCTTHCF
jgi:NhaP-type Na+/H+ or K+/H+ antiporter